MAYPWELMELLEDTASEDDWLEELGELEDDHELPCELELSELDDDTLSLLDDEELELLDEDNSSDDEDFSLDRLCDDRLEDDVLDDDWLLAELVELDCELLEEDEELDHSST